MTKTIYIFRHGQTDYNVARRVMGQLDIPLNDVGRIQAAELANKLETGQKKNIPWNYHGMRQIPGGARNLLPLAYERPSLNIRTKWSKTGKNREFLQKMAFFGIFYTTQTRTRPQISVFLPCPA